MSIEYFCCGNIYNVTEYSSCLVRQVNGIYTGDAHSLEDIQLYLEEKHDVKEGQKLILTALTPLELGSNSGLNLLERIREHECFLGLKITWEEYEIHRQLKSEVNGVDEDFKYFKTLEEVYAFLEAE